MLTDLRQFVAYVESALNSIRQEVEPLVVGTEGAGLEVNTDFFFLLSKLHDLGKDLSKLYNVNEHNLAERINKLITAQGLESIDKKFEDKTYRMTPDIKMFISCRADAKPQLLEWMRHHPLGKELIKEDVHPKSLEKFIKEEVLAKGEVPPAGVISLHSVTTINTRKLPK